MAKNPLHSIAPAAKALQAYTTWRLKMSTNISTYCQRPHTFHSSCIEYSNDGTGTRKGLTGL
jgi:hypothetical protein